MLLAGPAWLLPAAVLLQLLQAAAYLPCPPHTDGDVRSLAPPLYRERDILCDVAQSPEGLE
jgi:hypothetical protein